MSPPQFGTYSRTHTNHKRKCIVFFTPKAIDEKPRFAINEGKAATLPVFFETLAKAVESRRRVTAMLARHGQSGDTVALRQAAGLWLKEIREARGISQRELANILNLEYYTFISQMENGHGRIPQHKYRDFAAALGVNEKVFVRTLLMFYDPVSYEILFAGDIKTS